MRGLVALLALGFFACEHGPARPGGTQHDGGEPSPRGLLPDAGPPARVARVAAGLHPFRRGGKWGFFDASGHIAIEPQFDDAKHPSEGLAAVRVASLWGYVETATGKLVIPPRFSEATGFRDGTAVVFLPKGEGQQGLPPDFWRPHELQALAKREGLVGGVEDFEAATIDRSGTFRLSGFLARTSINTFLRTSRHVLRTDSSLVLRGHYVDADGGRLSSFDYWTTGVGGPSCVAASRISTRLLCGRRNDSDTSWRLPPRFTKAGSEENGIAPVCTEQTRGNVRCGLASAALDGGFAVQPTFLWVSDRSEDTYAVALATDPVRFGFIRDDGSFAHNPVFDCAANFSEGAAPVIQAGKLGFLSIDGGWLIQPNLEFLPSEWTTEMRLDHPFRPSEAAWSCTKDLPSFHNGLIHMESAGQVLHLDRGARVIFVSESEWEYAPTDGGVAGNTKQPTVVTSGTAFAVASDLLLTNEHVTRNCERLRVVGKDSVVTVVSTDPANDLSLLKANPRPTPSEAVLRVAPLRAGESVYLYGFPLAALSSSGTFGVGAVSSLRGVADNSAQFQFSAPLQPGNSGGPIVDSTGRVVGVATATTNKILFAALTGSIPENVNFAVKGTVVGEFLRSAGVAVPAADAEVTPLAQPTIADVLKGFTVQVECLTRRGRAGP